MVLVFLSISNYLIDSYTIFSASVLAANSVLRSLFGAAFPLFTTQMFKTLGIHWAASVPGFLALLCVPFPYLLYRYGPAIRLRCKFAAEADAFMRRMREDHDQDDDQLHDTEKEGINVEQKEDNNGLTSFEPITKSRTNMSKMSGRTEYEANPFDIDTINTQSSFAGEQKARSVRSIKSSKSGRFFKS
jgi:hypothetical protein